MVDNVIPFPIAGDDDPMDEEMMLSIVVNGKGEIEVLVNAFCETVEQHNWLIAKTVEAASRLVDRKRELGS